MVIAPVFLVELLLIVLRLLARVGLSGLHIMRATYGKDVATRMIQNEKERKRLEKKGGAAVNLAAKTSGFLVKQGVKKGITLIPYVGAGLDIAGGVLAYRFDDVIRIYRKLLKVIDFLLIVWSIITAAAVAVVTYLSITLVAVLMLVTTGALGGEAQGTANGGVNATAAASSGGNVAAGVYTGAGAPAPEGIDPTEWAKATPFQQRLAANAVAGSMVKGSGVAGQMPYDQGDTAVRVYDCSTFVSSVFESTGYTFAGKKKTKPAYDFNTNKKSDLEDYYFTDAMESHIRDKGIKYVDVKTDSNWKDKLVPGSVILFTGHVAMYVGKGTNGRGVIVQSTTGAGSTTIPGLLKGDMNVPGAHGTWHAGTPSQESGNSFNYIEVSERSMSTRSQAWIINPEDLLSAGK